MNFSHRLVNFNFENYLYLKRQVFSYILSYPVFIDKAISQCLLKQSKHFRLLDLAIRILLIIQAPEHLEIEGVSFLYFQDLFLAKRMTFLHQFHLMSLQKIEFFVPRRASQVTRAHLLLLCPNFN